jgi:hypothetical protein
MFTEGSTTLIQALTTLILAAQLCSSPKVCVQKSFERKWSAPLSQRTSHAAAQRSGVASVLVEEIVECLEDQRCLGAGS